MQQGTAPSDSANAPKLVVAWLFVGLPFAWGVFKTLVNAAALFK